MSSAVRSVVARGWAASRLVPPGVAALRRGLTRNEIVPYFQPKYSISDGRLSGVEALARWVRPDGRVMTPDSFLPVAEQAGFMPCLTRSILGQSLRQLRRWDRGGIEVPSVAVNVSAPELLTAGYGSLIAEQLAATNISATRLTVEITEDTLVADPTGCGAVLTQLRETGVQISLDDFGTGYSSLALLRDLPLDELKLDRSFGMRLDVDPTTAAIVSSTVDLAHALGLRLVTEGVERAAALHLLADYGCDVAQGFLLCRPVPAARFDAAVFSVCADALFSRVAEATIRR